MIIETKLWCYLQENENLGLPSEEMWMDVAINVSDIVAVKRNTIDDFAGENASVIFVRGQQGAFICSIPYQKSVELMIENDKLKR